jgi:hypothetical protein
MAVAEQEQNEQQQESSGGRSTALKAAAAAAATGAATLAVRKVMSHDDQGSQERDGDSGTSSRSSGKQGQNAGSILSTAASSAWESASDVVLPMAEDAVAAAGRYLAERAPDIVKERLVPRFIEAFNESN